jgi:hypothetical protein
MTSAAQAQAEAAASAAASAESRALQAREQLASAQQLFKVNTSPACLPCGYCHSPQNLESDALTRRRRVQEAQQKIAVRRRRYFPFEFFRACFAFSGTSSLLHTQDLQSSIACLKTLHNNPSLTKAPPLRDSIDDFSLKSDALMQRVGVMFALCTEEFSEHRRVGCGWDGVVDDARARLAHAQVIFLTLRLIARPSLPHTAFAHACFYRLPESEIQRIFTCFRVRPSSFFASSFCACFTSEFV